MTFQSIAQLQSAPETRVLLEDDDVRIDFQSSKLVRVDGRPVHLTEHEQELLLFLTSLEGRVATTSMLVRSLYRLGPAPRDLKIFGVIIHRIRTAFIKRNPFAGAAVRTVWGRGYAFGRRRATMSVPDGFPAVDCRWVASKKAVLLDAVAEQRVTVRELTRMYPDLSAEEFLEWQRGYEKRGHAGLFTTSTKTGPVR